MEVGARGDIDGRWSQHCTRTRSDHSVESIAFERLAVVVAASADRGGIRTVPVDRGVTEGWFHFDTGGNGDVTKLAAAVTAAA
jgi:hypothetical protein